MDPKHPGNPPDRHQPELGPQRSAPVGTGPARITPVDAGAGAEGNARLTSTTGALLLVLLAVEGLTVLSVRQMITLHVFVGVLLIGPVLLKSGSTLYRFARYYTGAAAYRAKGPPHPVLRILGPVVIISSLAVLGTGIALLTVDPSRSDVLLTAHKVSFAIWIAVTTVHVLGHLRAAALTSLAELRRPPSTPAARRRRMRLALITLALILGVAAATALLPAAAPWTTITTTHDQHRPGD